MAELIHYLHQQKEDNLSVVNHYGYEQAEKVCRFHSSFPEYTVTPLVRLENLAKLFGVKDIYVKDESYRSRFWAAATRLPASLLSVCSFLWRSLPMTSLWHLR